MTAGPPCALAVEIDGVHWFPNVYFSGWILVIGDGALALPILRAGCTLLARPLLALPWDAKTTKVALPVPQDPALVGRTLHLQGAARYVGFYFGPDLTQGLAVTFI